MADIRHSNERMYHIASLITICVDKWLFPQVTNRRCNYLASGVYVTVRQKDPLRSFMSSSVDTGVKTRHHDSRGSSRTSSRASSPISSQTDSCNRDASTVANKFRKIKTRATKVKKVPPSTCNAQTKSSPSIPPSTNLEVHYSTISYCKVVSRQVFI